MSTLKTNCSRDCIKIFFCTILIIILQSQVAQALDVYIVAGQSNGFNLSNIRSKGESKEGVASKHKLYYYKKGCKTVVDESTYLVLTSLDPLAYDRF